MPSHLYINKAYHACAVGKGKQIAKSGFDEKDWKQLTVREALPFLAKM
jgi:20S proteasome alpha/beta subunit